MEALINRGYQVIPVLHEPGPLADLLDSRRISYQTVDNRTLVGRSGSPISQIAAMARSYFALKRFLRLQDIDIVHTSDMRMHQTWWLPSRMSGALHVWHQHTIFARSRLAAMQVRRVPRVIGVSRSVCRSVTQVGQDACSVIYNPVVTRVDEVEQQECRRILLGDASAPEDRIIVAFAGNLRESKRPMDFVEVAMALEAAEPGRYLFAVFGVDREGWSARMNNTLGERAPGVKIHFMGHKYPLGPWLAACDYLLSTSTKEGFGLTLVEAMQVKTPVIATDIQGHDEIVHNGQNGWLVPVGDVQAMACTIRAMVSDPPGAEQLVETAYEQAWRRYTLEDHVSAVISVYRDRM